jgi:molecular chaperone GrpE
MTGSDEESQGPIIRDRRRIDPVTGQARESARPKHAAAKPGSTRRGQGPGSDTTYGNGPAGQPGAGDEARCEGAAAADAPEQVASLQQAAATAAAALAERTADLQRLQAEYANYRKRVDRDRAAVREQAVAGTLAGLLPVLDAIDQAREHGELSGGFKSVADSLQAALGRLGLVTYGEKGDAFDPKIHEALMHSYSSDVAEDTCVEILQPGYKVGERILRPARVAVAEPATGPDGSSNDAEWPAAEEGN